MSLNYNYGKIVYSETLNDAYFKALNLSSKDDLIILQEVILLLKN